MSRPNVAIDQAATVRQGISVKHCPLTCGLPTRMLKHGFADACARERRRQEHKRWDSGTVGVASTGHRQKLYVRCASCKGKLVPAELTFITEEEVMGGLSKTKKGKCALCNDMAVLKSNHKLDVCSNCANIQANINMRPAAVLKALGIMRPELLDGVGQAIADQIDQKVLARLAALVGYSGPDGDELLDRVELVVDQLAEAAMCNPTRAENCSMLLQAVGQYQERLAEMEKRLSEATAWTPVAEDAIAPADVAHLGHAFDRYKERCEELTTELQEARGAAGIIDGDLGESIRDIVSHSLTAQARLARAQGDLGYYATYLGDIRQALDLPDDFPADKVAYSVAMLRDDLRAATEQLELPTAGPLVCHGSSLDSHLLDMCLDAMRGRITGLDPDRIAVLREAA